MKILVALLVFSLIIIIHELGHFLLAKKNGITVVEFSLGMGPRLLSVQPRGGTRYSLKLLPLGGSCRRRRGRRGRRRVWKPVGVGQDRGDRGGAAV